MVTFAQLRDCDPESFRSFGGKWKWLWCEKLDPQADELDRVRKALVDDWEGDAHDAAAGKLRGLRAEVDDTKAPLLAVNRAFSDLTEEMKSAQGTLHDALDHAARIPAAVSADGEAVTYIGDDFRPQMRKTIEARIQRVFNGIDDALEAAAKADQRCAKRLRSLTPGSDPQHPRKGKISKDDIPPRGSDPKRVHEWWDSLAPAERQHAIHHHPDRIGWLDGIPITDRDQANKVSLVRAHEKADNRKRQIKARLKQLETIALGDDISAAARAAQEMASLERELKRIDKNLAGIKAIEDRLYRPDRDQPQAYLVGFSPQTAESDGRAIVAIGDPDTADNVATYVPGAGAELSNVGGDIDRADRMAADASGMAPKAETAVIMWLGYDAPDSVAADAPFEHYASDAAPDLRRFQEGLRVSHDGAPSHNTVLGHSYGSTVIGHTALDGGIDADSLVFVGSPGVGVNEVATLGMSADRVWATRADNDIIKVAAGAPGAHGDDPTDSSFGGQVFDSDDGSVWPPTAAHSAYWDKGNIARENMANIIVGNPDEVTGPTEARTQSPPTGPAPSPSPRPAPTPPRN